LLLSYGGSEFEDYRLRGLREAIETLYVCGEHERARELARQQRVHHVSLDLIEAERGRDVAACERVIAQLVRGIVAKRTAPFEGFGQRPIRVGFA
jgi:hypothetical protein